jgi:hypothetical protein
VLVTAGGIKCRDRGFDNEGNQVWGSEGLVSNPAPRDFLRQKHDAIHSQNSYACAKSSAGQVVA